MSQVLAQRLLFYQHASGGYATIYEVGSIYLPVIFKGDEAIRRCLNAKDIAQQVNPKGL